MEEISEEEFERLKEWKPRKSRKIDVFKNASTRMNRYDRQINGWKYNRAYNRVLDARRRSRSLVDEAGNVSHSSLRVIEMALRDFEMGRQMDEKFTERLRKKLGEPEVKTVLKKFRDLRIDSLNLEKFKADAEKLYNALSASGRNGLSARQDSFDVGAAKTMNFLFPELFVIVDRYVKRALNKSGPLYFKKYWNIMMICRDELEKWKRKHGSTDSLIELDKKPTTLTRIFDKCAFVIGKYESY